MSRAPAIVGLGVGAVLVSACAGFALAELGLALSAALWFGAHLHAHLGSCGPMDWWTTPPDLIPSGATHTVVHHTGCLRGPSTWGGFGIGLGAGIGLTLLWWSGWSRLASAEPPDPAPRRLDAKSALAIGFGVLTVLWTVYDCRSIMGWY